MKKRLDRVQDGSDKEILDTEMKTRIVKIQYALDTVFLDSENENEAKLIRLDPIIIYAGRSRGAKSRELQNPFN
jgi:hypothetical protein